MRRLRGWQRARDSADRIARLLGGTTWSQTLMRPPDPNRFNCAVAGFCALVLGALLGGCASSRDGGAAGPSATDPAAATGEQAGDGTPVDVAKVARRSGYKVVNQCRDRNVSSAARVWRG